MVVLSYMGVYGGPPLLLTWAMNNTAPAGRRAIVSAWLVMFGNISGIVGSFMFLDSEAPVYNTGFGLLAGFSLVGLIGACILWVSWRKENLKRGLMSEDQVRAQFGDKELLRMGDKSPFFRFTL